MNTCAIRGYLISGNDQLPTDATDFLVDGLPIVGCNNLVCERCKAAVRNAVELGFRSKDELDLAPVYETADLATHPELVAIEPEYRLYLCRCDRWLKNTRHKLYELDRDLNDPDMPWGCDGHPVLALPADVDGASIADHTGLAEVTGRVLRGWVPPGARPDDAKRAAWGCRLHERVGRQDVGPIEDAVVAALDDPDAVVRARAIAFVIRIPFEAGMRRALAILQTDRGSVAGVRDEITAFNRDKTLELSLWRATGPLLATDGTARDLARAEALAAGKGSRPLYDVLSTHDPGWVLAHVEQIVRATPELRNDLGYSFASFPRTVSADEACRRLAAVQL